MKLNTRMPPNLCRQAEYLMNEFSRKGGIKEGERVIVSAEKCSEAASLFAWAWSNQGKGGKFSEIITPNEFTREEIKAILERV